MQAGGGIGDLMVLPSLGAEKGKLNALEHPSLKKETRG